MYLFAEVTIGFTVPDQHINEAAGVIAIEVSVLLGTLQRSVNVSFKTMESTLGNAATSELMREGNIQSLTCLLIAVD